MKEDNVVYQYTCNWEGCSSSKYVGYTTNKLSIRMKQHYYSGSIKKHHINEHDHKISYDEIYNNTIILEKRPTRYELQIEEALKIKKIRPNINEQHEKFDRTLKIF
jgi:hypothetical protein